MSKNLYRNYSIGDFDKFDCLKLSKTLYLAIIFILRGYVVYLLSMTNIRDQLATLQWVYPDTRLFYLSLISGSLGLLMVVLLLLRKPSAPKWVKKLWPFCRRIIIAALIVDLVVNFIAYYFWQMQTLNWLIFQVTMVIVLIVLTFTSQRFKLNLQEFPEKLTEP